MLALGEEGLYVASENDRRLYRIDRDTGEVRNGPALAVPDAVGVTDAGVVAIIDDPPGLATLDPVTLEPERTVALAGDPAGLVVVDDVIWVRDGTGRTARFGAEHLEELDDLAAPLTAGLPGRRRRRPVAFGPRGGDRAAARPRTGEVLATVDIDGEPRGVVVDEDGVWVADVANDRVLHVDPASGSVDRSIDVGRFPHGMALGDGRLWVTNFESGTLTTIDTDRGVVLTTVPIGVRPGGLKFDGGTLWVSVHQEGLVRAVDPDRLEAASILPTAETEHEVDLGGRSLFIRCMGSGEAGSPTVLLDAMAGQWSEHQLFVQYGLQSTHRVCAYDRAGLGRSDPDVEPRTPQRIVDDLDAALDAAGIPGPYVLVGHQQGGLYARLFAAQHADEVARPGARRLGHADVRRRASPPPRPEEEAALDAGLADPELAGIEESGGQVTASGSLGDLPLVVVTGDGMLSHLGPDAVELWQRHPALAARPLGRTASWWSGPRRDGRSVPVEAPAPSSRPSWTCRAAWRRRRLITASGSAVRACDRSIGRRRRLRSVMLVPSSLLGGGELGEVDEGSLAGDPGLLVEGHDVDGEDREGACRRGRGGSRSGRRPGRRTRSGRPGR